MPPTLQRKKGSSQLRTSGIAPSRQKGIQAFGKVTKAQVHDGGKSALKRKHHGEVADIENQDPEDRNIKRSKTSSEKSSFQLQVVVPNRVEPTATSESRKRKASEEPTTPPPPEQKDITAAQDRKRKKTTASSHKLTDTPTKGARSLLEKFALASSSAINPPTTSPTPPNSSHALPSSPGPLPSSLVDLINLHSSFLTALTLHHAHNGPSAPVDLHTLCPSISRTWKTRAVTPTDIRSILAFHPPETIPFHLTTHNNSRLCIETTTQNHQPLNEPLLNKAFTQALSEKWTAFTTTHNNTTPSTAAFLANLPLHPLPPTPSPTNPPPSRRQLHPLLSDLKSTAQARHGQQSLPTPTPTPTPLPRLNKTDAKARTTSLLDRLSSKSAHASTLPAPLTPAQASRRRALARLPEVAPILQSLVVGRQKHDFSDTTSTPTHASSSGLEAAPVMVTQRRQTSFSMSSLVQDLQMSLRNPMAREEAVECVRCLAEVAPEWVGVWEVGGVVGVVVKGVVGVGRGVLEERVRVLGG